MKRVYSIVLMITLLFTGCIEIFKIDIPEWTYQELAEAEDQMFSIQCFMDQFEGPTSSYQEFVEYDNIALDIIHLDRNGCEFFTNTRIHDNNYSQVVFVPEETFIATFYYSGDNVISYTMDLQAMWSVYPIFFTNSEKYYDRHGYRLFNLSHMESFLLTDTEVMTDLYIRYKRGETITPEKITDYFKTSQIYL